MAQHNDDWQPRSREMLLGAVEQDQEGARAALRELQRLRKAGRDSHDYTIEFHPRAGWRVRDHLAED